jgi:anaerobic selenocysteine-containing dehydrogenase
LITAIALAILERYDDADTPYGCGETVYSLATPVIAPRDEARNAAEVLLDLAKELKADIRQKNFVEVLKDKAAHHRADWTDLSNGKAYVDSHHVSAQMDFRVDIFNKQTEPAAGIRLAPITRLGLGTAQSAIPPYSVKLLTVREVIGNKMVVQLNPATADKLGLSEGQECVIRNAPAPVRMRVHLSEHIMPGVVCLPAGLGHTAFDEFSQDKGANTAMLAAPALEPGTGLYVWNTVYIDIDKA